MKKLSPLLLLVVFSLGLEAAQLPIALGAASTFTVLGASTVTNTGPSSINGNLGVSPGTAITGFPPGVVTGGAIHAADGPSGLAQGDLTTAFIDAAGRTIPALVAGDLGGLTLAPGLYKSTTTLSITGVLRLDGQGDPNAVFIFQIASALNTASGSQIILQGGAQAANIFWQVGSSATLGTTSIFNGTIMAQASISLATGAALNGRALARTGAVTLDTNTIVNPGPPTTNVPPAPLTVTCPGNSAQAGVVYNSLLVATGGVPPYAFSVTGTLPAGLTLAPSSGAISGTPIASGTSNFTVKVTDSATVVATQACSINTIAAVTPPPVLTLTCPVSPAQVGVAYNSSFTAGGGTPAYTYSFTGSLPVGLTLNATSGAVTGTPTTASTLSFTAKVVDSAAVTTTKSCSITTTPPALTLTCPSGSAQVGVAYTSSLVAAGGTPPYSYSLTGTLPAGLNLNATSGAITGTPTGAGVLSFTANALDAGALTATKGCSIASAPAALTLTCPATSAQAGVAYNSPLLAAGGTAPYTYSVVGALPAGLSLNASTGAITGTPTASGTSSFTANVVDSGALNATKSCSIAAAPALLTLACPVTTAQAGVAYNSPLLATGGTKPYTYSIVGTLLAGLGLNASTGAITGTPTTEGTIAFTANVLDAAAVTATKSCSITASPAIPAQTPAPSSLILVSIGFGCLGLYRSRERILQLIRRS